MAVREHIAMMIKKRIKDDKIISQKNLAKGLGISEPAVSKMIKSGKVDYENLINLCKLIELTPNELLGYETNQDEREILDIINNNENLKIYIKSIKK